MAIRRFTLTPEAREMMKLLMLLSGLLLLFVVISLVSPGPEAWPSRMQSNGPQAHTRDHPGATGNR